MDKIKGALIGVFMLIAISTANAQAPTQLVVNYDLGQIPDFHPGDVGTAIIVIQNNGGHEAREVKAWIPETGQVSGGGTWNLGTMSPGQSVTLKTTLRVDENAYMGAHTITLFLDYKSYWRDDDNRLDSKNEKTNWVIPIDVIALPNFQIEAEKIKFYEDTLSDLILTGRIEDGVRDLSATVSSECVTILNSAKQYIGDIDPDQEFNLEYQILPESAGTCNVDVSFNFIYKSGSTADETIKIGLIIQESDVDFKIIDVNYPQTSPGDTIEFDIEIKNIGSVDAEDVAFSLDLEEPFIPVQTTEKYVGLFKSDETKSVGFSISIAPDAETKAYKIPLIINYRTGGTIQNTTKEIGVDVTGKVQLEVIDTEISRGKLRIEVANIGSRDANAVRATLRSITSNGTTAKEEVAYKDYIKPNKQTTFSFDVPGKEAELVLEYTGLNNKRIEVVEAINIPKGTTSQEEESTEGGGFPWWIVPIIIIIIAAVIYKYRKEF